MVIGGEAFDVYYRDIIACIRDLFGKPEFASSMKFSPERHYADEDETIRIYSDLHTGRWWWATQVSFCTPRSVCYFQTSPQVELEKDHPGATIIPLIISTDKTQLTLFRNKSAYPVYLTIGNIPKEIRRKPSLHAQVLLGYLPAARLEHIKNRSSRRRALANLFHACMAKILQPLETAGVVGIELATGDGVVHRCYPLLAVFVGDYPEQCLVSCVKHCPTCPTPKSKFGEDHCLPPRDLEPILNALDSLHDDPTTYTKTCEAAGIKPVVNPFWASLPYVHIYQSITPDVLHQLYQGVIKHVVSWIFGAFDEAEIDARCRRLPPNHNIRIFSKGISSLSRVSGKEHADMCRILLGLIINMRTVQNTSAVRLVRAVRGVLDFLYTAQFPSQTDETLATLTESLSAFHDNKEIFIELGIRDSFNIPKIHSMQHYTESIRNYGATDNYNTEYTERLHIDLAKDAYNSTNHKDEFTQMTLWLERKEKVIRHAAFIEWRLSGQPPPLPPVIRNPHVQMTRNPTKVVSLTQITLNYNAPLFSEALQMVVAGYQHPTASQAHLNYLAPKVSLPFTSVPVFHKIRFWNQDPYRRPDCSDVLDVAHVCPRQKGKRGWVPERFDTVLIDHEEGTNDLASVRGQFSPSLLHKQTVTRIAGCSIAQVHVVFQFPENASLLLGCDIPSCHFAYVEWFSKIGGAPDRNHKMFKVTRLSQDGRRVGSIIPLSRIRRSVHLFPKFGQVAPREWTSATVLEKCDTFYVNQLSDRHSYITVC